MHKVMIHLGKRSYPIFIDQFNLQHTMTVIKKTTTESRVFIVSHPRLKKMYGAQIQNAWGRGRKIIWILIPEGEKKKTLATVEKILTRLSRARASRQSLMIALGGGVVTDVVGLTAALYMRGIDFMALPTTLLAQVDAAIGGKNGVDLKSGKNLAGTFYQPRAVCVHTEFLKSLPEREYRSGLAEVVKYSMVKDRAFFYFLDRNKNKICRRDPSTIKKLIYQSCVHKKGYVENDENDTGQRQHLNFGHTLGHAIEVLTGFHRIQHGEAVAMGMVFATRLSYSLGLTTRETITELTRLLQNFDLPTVWPRLAGQRYIQTIQRDKKSDQTSIRFILPRKIGKAEIVSVMPKDVLSCLKNY